MTDAKSRSVKIELEYPFDYKGALIKEMTLRRPKGSDMRFLPSGNPSIEGMFPFFALLAGVDEAVFDDMDAADLGSIGDIVGDFLTSKRSKNARRPQRGGH